MMRSRSSSLPCPSLPQEALVASKLDAIAAEYNHLLACQLDSQRQYYEGLLAQVGHEKGWLANQAGQSGTGTRKLWLCFSCRAKLLLSRGRGSGVSDPSRIALVTSRLAVREWT